MLFSREVPPWLNIVMPIPGWTIPGPWVPRTPGGKTCPGASSVTSPWAARSSRGGWFCWRRRYADLAHPTQRMRPV
uniref:Uncharacterized protein n=1 Tax=Human herpesvirus 2 TaxID=10310 RepID=A0A481TBU5_HHV2|nr:hypothetical protein [Human alphaherpesvirus 2]QBH78567.1 hypothetical protein [Human alphaherpesvirus 2]